MDDLEEDTNVKGKGHRSTGNHSNKKKTVQYDVPVDTGWSWVVLLGAFGVCTLAIGGLKSFGVLFVELSRTYSVSSRALASIQSLTGFFFLGIGPISNALGMRYSHRLVVFTGGVITLVGLVLSSFAKSVEVLYITYGVITGFGLGLSFSSTLVIVAYYFDKKRSLANGFAMSGSGIGSTGLPYLMRYLMDVYSVQGCFLIMGAVMGHICLFGLVFRPIYQYPVKQECILNNCEEKKLCRVESEEVIHQPEEDTTKDKNLEGIVKHVKPGLKSHLNKDYLGQYKNNTLLTEFSSQPNISTSNNRKIYSSSERFKSQELVPLRGSKSSVHSGNSSVLFAASFGVLTSLSSQNIPHSVNTKHQTVRTSQCKDEEQVTEIGENDSNVKGKCCQSLPVDWTLFKDPAFILFLVSIFCVTFGYHSVFNLLPPYADELKMNDKSGAFLVAVYGIADFCGRFLVGFCMDFCVPWKQKIYFLCTFLVSFGVLLTPQFDTIIGISIFCGFYGFFGGGYNGTLMSVLVDTLGLERISTAWGFMCFSASIAMFLNPFLSGLMKDVTGTWKSSFRLMGSIATVGSLILLLQPLVQNRKNLESKQETIYIEELETS